MQRPYLELITSRINEPRKFIQVLYGPRQVGKTTLISQILQDSFSLPYIFATSDDTIGASSTWLRETWSRARKLYNENSSDVLLIIDEIQKIDNWSEIVKKEWDMDTFNKIPIKVILIGSSSLLIQKGLTESLAGRFELIYIPHWSYKEMHDAFGLSIDEYIWFGGYPGATSLIHDELRWKNFVKKSLIETSISKDILMLTRIDKPALLHRLFEIGSSYSAQILSLTKIQAELMEKGNVQTLENYLYVLSSAGLLTGLEKYSPTIIRRRASKPKFQVYNNALMSAQSDYVFSQAIKIRKLWGRLCESAVGAHLLNFSLLEDYKLYYWNENSSEVDFIIQRGEKNVALEVKSGKDSSNIAMAKFDKMYHPSAMYIIGTDGIPIEEFLLSNPADLF